MGYTHSSVQRLPHCRHDADSHTAAVNTKAGRKHKGGTDNMPKHSQPNIKQNANKTGADQPSHGDQEYSGYSQTVILITDCECEKQNYKHDSHKGNRLFHN